MSHFFSVIVNSALRRYTSENMRRMGARGLNLHALEQSITALRARHLQQQAGRS
jgi:hypothetical protein